MWRYMKHFRHDEEAEKMHKEMEEIFEEGRKQGWREAMRESEHERGFRKEEEPSDFDSYRMFRNRYKRML